MSLAVLEIIIMYGDYRGGRWCCARPWRYVGSWVTVVVMRLTVLWVVIMYWVYLGMVMVMCQALGLWIVGVCLEVLERGWDEVVEGCGHCAVLG